MMFTEQLGWFKCIWQGSWKKNASYSVWYCVHIS